MNLNNATELLGILSFSTAALACFVAWRRRGGIWGALTAVYLSLVIEVLLGKTTSVGRGAAHGGTIERLL